eukprot:5890637-Amphidinium_carterae.1
MARALVPGDVVYVHYGEATEPWHERILTCRGVGNVWSVLTPDFDHYCEDLDTLSVRIGDGVWGLPEGIGVRYGAPVYRFSRHRRPTNDRVRNLIVEGGTVVAEDAQDPGGVQSEVELTHVARAGHTWLCLFGSQVGLGSDSVIGRMQGSVVTKGAPQVSHVWLQVPVSAVATHVAAFNSNTGTLAGHGEVTLGDARVIPIQRTTAGERFRDLRSASDRYKEESFDGKDWPIEGPRTCGFVLEQIARTGTLPVTRHKTWRTENKLDAKSGQATLHLVCSECLELLACTDQLDMTNIAGAEALARRLQLVEYDVLKKTEEKVLEDGGEYFLGRSKRAGGAIIAPELLRHVAERASRDSAILKETRKAAEEKALARKHEK